MTAPTPLNPLTIPVHGIHLIEASAGTGKTWNIAALFTRLVLLEKQNVEKILVVTFTKAATAELKTRLRARLDQALTALKRTPNAQTQPETLRQNSLDDKNRPDDFLFHLLTQALASESQERLQLRLTAAISNFDNAAIYTIHGFCQRILQDFAFYCQTPFNIQLNEDPNDNPNLIAIQDYWRTQIAPNPVQAQLVYQHNQTPEKQLQALSPYLARPYLQLRQPENECNEFRRSQNAHIAQTQQAFQQAWQHVCAQLPQIQAAFWQLHPHLNKQSYNAARCEDRFARLHQFSGCPSPATIWQLLTESSHTQAIFTAEFLQSKANQDKKSKQKIQLPAEPLALIDTTLGALATAAQAHIQAESQALIQLSHNIIHYLRAQNEADKKTSPNRQFDDLLLDVYHALSPEKPHAQALARALSANWQTALIDEFQDTDPLQYAIFQAAFMQPQRQPENECNQNKTAFYMVGDPKQAIYSFRGADIYAYLAAADTIPPTNRHTLSQNHRSHAALVHTVNALFSRPNPFALPQIPYTPARAARSQSTLPAGTAPLRLTWLNQDPTADNSDPLAQRAAQWCAQEIAVTLHAHAQGKTPISAGQIAILVRTRKEGTLMQRQLKTHHIQSVLLSRDSIYAEEETQAVYALISFILNPQRTQHLIYLLSGCLYNHTAAQIQQLNQNEAQLTQWTDAANQAAQTWQQHGVYTALQQFLRQSQAETTLLSQRNDRTLTNLHQILEILATQDEKGQPPSALQQWLGQQIQASQNHANPQDHALLRLESDENLVKIVTMHAAKGLQYPVVYCPFVWKARNQQPPEWQIIHQNHQAQLIHKTQLTDSDQQQAQTEQRSEDLRLLYVALTRAEEQLNVYIASYQHTADSPLAYLIQHQQPEKGKAGKDEYAHIQAQAYRQSWQNFIAQHPEHIQWHDTLTLPTYTGSLKTENTNQAQPHNTQPTYQATAIPPRSYRSPQHTSFTALSRHSTALPSEQTPLDPGEQTAPPQQNSLTPNAPPTIAQFPQGTAAGICLHSLLERYPFAQPGRQNLPLIQTTLDQHNINSQQWQDTIAQLIEDTRHTPLLPRTSLSTLPPQNILTEFGFLLHTQNFTLGSLKTWFSTQSNLPPEIIAAAQNLSFRDVQGYINGYIDLLAQTPQGDTLILDYKSNWLGNSPSDYTQAALNQAVAQHHYALQALLYAIATARYLTSRNASPATLHIRYLFLRGLDGITSNGVWQWDIPTSSLKQWL
ncbi:exodeoxyribonuclease V subunit beta [Kingella oralis]|uniref:exodeoxyribonuclease V subunit beta n=1 Tax=Kingella oralis TaxID=505 RepID=UPI0034E4C709